MKISGVINKITSYSLKELFTTFILLLFLVFANPLSAEEKSIILGEKDFTEGYILAEIAKQLLEKNGFKVRQKHGAGTNIVRKSLEYGEIDLYYEYTGTAYAVFYKQEDLSIMSDSNKLYRWIREKDKEKNLIWLDPLKFNNSYILLMKRKKAEEMNITTISEMSTILKKDSKALSIGLNPEFKERPDGFKSLMKVYGFYIPYKNLKTMDAGITYLALTEDKIDVAMGYATDGRIRHYGLTALLDDKEFFPVYNPSPVIRKEVLDNYPEVEKFLKVLTEKLTLKDIKLLNYYVDIEHKNIVSVCIKWMKENGLL